MSDYVWYHVTEAEETAVKYVCKTLEEAEEFIRKVGHPDWRIFMLIKKEM